MTSRAQRHHHVPP